MERLTVREAAERLEISEQAVRKRVQRGTLPHAKAHGHVYVFLDSEPNTADQRQGMESDDQLTLNYIDKLYSAWQTICISYRRYTLLLLAISVIVLALSGGAVSAEGSVKFAGIGLRVPLAVFMITGAVLITALLNSILNLEDLQSFYQDEIRSLYKSLGLAKSAMDSAVDPFVVGRGIMDVLAFNYTLRTESPASEEGTSSTSKSTLKARGAAILTSSLFVILPAAAQAGVGYKISELQVLDKDQLGWFPVAVAYIGEALAYIMLPQQRSDWVSDLFVVLAFLTALVPLPFALREAKKEADGGEEGERKAQADAEGLYTKKPPITSRRGTKLLMTLFFLAFLGSLAWIGVWLGYFVAAS